MTHLEAAQQVVEVYNVLETVNPTALDGGPRTSQMGLAWSIVQATADPGVIMPRGLGGPGLSHDQIAGIAAKAIKGKKPKR